MARQTVQRTAQERLSSTFAALADPTRRALLDRLRTGPATVGELAAPLPMTLAAVSKHLGVLESAGLVARGRAGQYRPARLEAAPLADAAAWLDEYAELWRGSLEALGRLVDRPAASASPERAPDVTPDVTPEPVITERTDPMADTFTVEYEFAAPPTRVWAAWTTPALFSVWFGTEAVIVPIERIVLDVRVGGALRATMILPDGSEKDWEGEFTTVEPPTRLAFTLTDVPGTDPGPPVVVDLAPTSDGGTRLALRQSSHHFDDDGIAAVTAGYLAFFEAMARALDADSAGAVGR